MSNQETGYRTEIQAIISHVSQVVFGVEDIVRQMLISIICNDHILLEDVPGTGKTMLTNIMAEILELEFKRVQGTPDLLPGDLTGVNIYNQSSGLFEFIEGPVFTNILLFDEINRASPKTQSALLEAMAERQISVDNTTHLLEKPFLVIATQNPVEHLGTYPLPQAQLDRFLIKTTIGYPTREQEKNIMLLSDSEIEETSLPKLKKSTIEHWQSEFTEVFVHDNIIEKLLNIIEKTRDTSKFELGISPRASRKFIRAIKASAFIHGRDFVNKDDIFDLFIPIMAHRVYAHNKNTEKSLLEDLLNSANF